MALGRRGDGISHFVNQVRIGKVSRADLDVALAALVKAAQERPDAVADLVQVLDAMPSMRIAIRQVLFNDVDVEDALQEALLAIARSISTFEGRASIQTWTGAIAKNKAVDVLRRREATHFVMADAAPIGPEAKRFSSQWATRSDVENALAALSPKLRMVFELAENQGLTYDEISDLTNVPRNTVASRLRRARSQLQMDLTIAGGR